MNMWRATQAPTTQTPAQSMCSFAPHQRAQVIPFRHDSGTAAQKGLGQKRGFDTLHKRKLEMIMNFWARLSGLALATSAQAITYTLDVDVGAGNASGFIETDGTLGVLTAGNITSWEITLNAPNLWFGPTDVIGTTTASQGISLLGASGQAASGLTATATDILFDFGGNTAALFNGGDRGNYLCLQGQATGACKNQFNLLAIGFDAVSGNAEEATMTGNFALASVTTVPVPASLPLLLAGVGLFGLVRRRAR